MDKDAIDTTSIREGILFYQDADGNTGYYWDSEVGICAPSLIPTESELWKDQEISGDTPDLDAINYQRIAQQMNRNRNHKEHKDISHDEKYNKNITIIDDLSSLSEKNLLIEEENESAESLVEPVEKMTLYPSTIPESPSSTLIEPVRNLSLNDPSLNNNQESPYYDNSNFNLYRQESYLLTDFFTDSCYESFEDDSGERNDDSNENDESDRINNEINNCDSHFNYANDVIMEERNFDDNEPPSPTSTRDPESDCPTLSQSEAIAWEYFQHFVGREFQDEAGLDYGENPGGKVWDDDEGMDPLENQ
ncbi:17606_t:CDS:1 [Cetraspora pellucida]|uniref:17606_t:CDS:1 n=1 Tax=Cetraspora pellucida TaxID=1433469 RepID=A0A9N9FKH4_9GLOM|nr:17606_t:CDS:1 [Cetraspora pellucida]